MARGNASQVQVFYKGSSDEQFTIFVESEEALRNWKKDSSIPMTEVVAGWKIMVAEHGKQGILGTASKSQLENEFGTTNEDEIVKKILTNGDVQSHESSERIGVTNETMGGRVSHN